MKVSEESEWDGEGWGEGDGGREVKATYVFNVGFIVQCPDLGTGYLLCVFTAFWLQSCVQVCVCACVHVGGCMHVYILCLCVLCMWMGV